MWKKNLRSFSSTKSINSYTPIQINQLSSRKLNWKSTVFHINLITILNLRKKSSSVPGYSIFQMNHVGSTIYKKNNHEFTLLLNHLIRDITRKKNISWLNDVIIIFNLSSSQNWYYYIIIKTTILIINVLNFCDKSNMHK